MDVNQVTTELVQATLQRRWGLTAKRTGGEWHSPCPECGGRDRFIIFQNGGYFCRVCGMTGWLDDDKPSNRPDPALLAKWKEDNDAREQRRVVEVAARLAELKTAAERDAYLLWRDDERKFLAREYFASQGISDWAISFYGLGYTPSLTVKRSDGSLVQLPAFTIPIRNPATWEIVNMQYRLADPVPDDVGGKYRQAVHLPAAIFYAYDHCDGDLVLVEGAKKSIVLYEFMRASMQVAGLPGCGFVERFAAELKQQNARRTWVWLDPGAEQPAHRYAVALGARIIRTTRKPDDCVAAGLTLSELRALMSDARRI